MTKLWMALAGLVLGSGVEAQQAAPAAPVRVTLTRLDCGRSAQARDLAGFSDTYASHRKALVSSCYLIRHGDEYLLWDTGYPVALRDDPKAQLLMPMSVLDQLKRLGVEPARIGRVGISHYHGDHTGQARDFPDATLLIGAGDWSA
jgi:glyoxylase-like metal-dependent hydrolase (beta-lactamase superfamily II)